MYGWAGCLAIVDLSERAIEPFCPLKSLYHACYGGATLAARLLLEETPANADPLGPHNGMCLTTGPLTGTRYPGAGRATICARSPLAGAWGESSVGGHFGRALKLAGLDGLLIRGAAEEPVYILIEDERREVRSAGDLWGMDTYATEDELHARHGKRCEVLCVGPAGERRVRIAAISHRKGEAVAGRCGLGGVMGAKNLKAIVVRGSQKVPVADPEAFEELCKETIQQIRAWDYAPILHDLGTGATLDVYLENGRAPTKNWQGVPWPEGKGKIGADVIRDTIRVGRAACYGCPLACRKVIEIDEGPYDVGRAPGPEYETLAAMGAMLLIDDLGAICKANDLANRLGIDTISAGTAIAWAMEAYERGLICEEQTGGIRLEWGNVDALLRLVGEIGRDEGFGALLGEGSLRAAREVGHGSEEFAMQVKGLAFGMHHPKVSRGQELSYATSPRGASHCDGGSAPWVEGTTAEDWVRAVSESIDEAGVPNALCLCMFLDMAFSRDLLAATLTAATGVTMTEEDLTQLGARGWYLKRLFNLKHGIGAEADRLPSRIKEQIAAVGGGGMDTEVMLERLRRIRQLDEEGWPSQETLTSLGIEDVTRFLA
jgi:aldehyde:ferredoxin oxidoreductase